MIEKYAFIGDIHGVLDPVVRAVEHAQAVADSIVFLGDYVNRGAQSRQVLDFLIDLNGTLSGRVHFLSGHHDIGFLNAVENDGLDVFLRMGGAATLSSYPRLGERGDRLRLQERVPASHIAFLRALVPSFTAQDVVAMHDQADAPPENAERFGVFGHRVQTSAEPAVTDAFALIDTGCGTLPDGRLTCFQWPSRRWFQVTA